MQFLLIGKIKGDNFRQKKHVAAKYFRKTYLQKSETQIINSKL
jgi:hypothetical protein